MASKVYGIDLGTKHLKVYKKNSGVIYDEKNVMAVNEEGTILAFGDEAYDMYEKAPGYINIVFPISKGVIADYTNMTAYIQYIVNASSSKGVGKLDFYIAVPTNITDVCRRSFVNLIEESKIKSKRINIIEKTIADACGAGLDVNTNKGIMIVDIGASTTEMSIISSGGIVYSNLLPIGGNDFDEAIAFLTKKKFNVIIGNKTAELIKFSLVDIINESNEVLDVMGRNLVSGLPREVKVDASLVSSSIIESVETIATAIKSTLERTPPEISSDIYEKGIYLCGGSAKLKGLSEYIYRETGVKVNVVDDPEDATIRGVSRIIEDDSLKNLAFLGVKSKYE